MKPTENVGAKHPDSPPNRPIEDLNYRDVQIIEKIHGLGLLHINISKNPYNPDIPIDEQPRVKHSGRKSQLECANSLQDILQGIRADKLPIFVPGSPLSKGNICVIDIDYGDLDAAREVCSILNIEQGDCVLTKSGRQTRYHLWVVAKNPKRIVNTRKTWKTSLGGGEVLYRSCVTGWDPTKNLYKWLKRAKKGKVRPVDVSGILEDDASTSKRSKLPNSSACPPKLTKIIGKLIKPISGTIRPKVQEAYLRFGAVQESERNETLNKVAFGLGGQYAHHPSHQDIKNGLYKIARLIGLDDGEVQSTIRSGWKAGEEKRLELDADGKKPRFVENMLSNKVEGSRSTDKDTLCVSDHAFILAKELQGEYIHDHRDGCWYRYGKHWSSDEAGPDLESAITQYVREQVSDGTLRPGRHLPGIEKPLRVESKMRLPTGGQWNPDQYLIGLPDGRVYDARTDEYRDGQPSDYINKTIAVVPRKGSKKERKALWQFMMHMVALYPDIPGVQENIIEWLFTMRGLGYLGEADRDGKILWLYSDVGGTGKSTFIDSLLHAVGTYGVVIADENMSARSNPDHLQYLAATHGARTIANDDTPRRGLNAAVIKKLATGSKLAARHMRKENFYFDSVASLFFASNHIPIVEGDGGMQRRLTLLQMKLPETKDSDFIRYITSNEMLEVWAYQDLKGAHRAVADSASRDVPPPVQIKSDEILGEGDIFERWVASRIKKIGKLSKRDGGNRFTPTVKFEGAFNDDKLRYGWKEGWNLSRFKRALEKNGLPSVEGRKRLKDGSYPRGFKEIRLIDNPKRV